LNTVPARRTIELSSAVVGANTVLPSAVVQSMRYFVTAAKGTEGVLRDELRELGVRHLRADRGGVHVDGPPSLAWRLCLRSRIGVRVYESLATGGARDADELYDLVRAVEWERFLSPRHTLAVGASAKNTFTNHTQFLSRRVKDGVVDRLRAREGERPSVDLDDPDVRLFLHGQGEDFTLYRDLSGDPLHMRGYRRHVNDAPLKETLAAAILRLSGWTRGSTLIDPMCGSGTIAIEADLWARDVAPGLGRRFGFERHLDFDDVARRSFEDIRAECERMALDEGPVIIGSDIDGRALLAAKENARAARSLARFSEMDVRFLAPKGFDGAVVTNPPYGERLDGGMSFYREMAQALAKMNGHTVTVLAGTPMIEDALNGERPLREASRPHQVFNGPIECRVLRYRVPNRAEGADPVAVEPGGRDPR
jgi:putative N6-adenine-specific DNA methylase